MRYVSTRGGAPPVSFLDAVLAGLAPDGGLYVPESWPSLDAAYVRETGLRDYASVASVVLATFAGAELAPKALHDITQRAYGAGAAFDTSAITPLHQLGANHWLLDLARGPSLAFKDIAMQLIAPLYDHALAERARRLTVVCATSGDTGGAAVEALKRSERADLFVLLPRGRVSDVQRRFMTSSGGAHVHALEIDGDFDACQAIVKGMFADADFAGRAGLSGVNSINWARIVAQSVYFLRTASALSAPGPVDFVVPSGNMGDAFAGYVAMKLGAPIGRIGLATNSNDILARAIRTGRYERAASSAATLSPAMDIQVASNFERLLHDATGDAEEVARAYRALAQSGGFNVPAAALAAMRETFSGIAADDAMTLAKMAEAHKQDGLLICPHTAVGFAAYGDEPKWFDRPTTFLATAHPAKFPDTVEQATGVRPPLPAKCADLYQRPEKFDAMPADAEAVKRYISERSRAWA
jgi:threonine synthase